VTRPNKRLVLMVRRAAQRLGISRSELYAKTLATFLEEDEGEDVTQEINRALQGTALPVHPVIARAQAGRSGRTRVAWRIGLT
jgi:predicted protein tyrosine phosphatase